MKKLYGVILMEKQTVSINQTSVIFETLAEKIYKNPFITSIRETLANALDIHSQTNCDKNVDFDVSDVNDDILITIRDYGSGITPEKYAECYTFFYSNKGNSNLSGEYGLGAKSPYGILYKSIKNNFGDFNRECHGKAFFVTSYTGGVKNIYVHFLDEHNTPSFANICTSETTEEDGLMVQFYVDNGCLLQLDDTFMLSFGEKIKITTGKYGLSVSTSLMKKHQLYNDNLIKFNIANGVECYIISNEVYKSYNNRDGYIFFKRGDIVYNSYNEAKVNNVGGIVGYTVLFVVNVDMRNIKYTIPSSRDIIDVDYSCVDNIQDTIASYINEFDISSLIYEYSLALMDTTKKYSVLQRQNGAEYVLKNKVSIELFKTVVNKNQIEVPLLSLGAVYKQNNTSVFNNVECLAKASDSRYGDKSIFDDYGRIIGGINTNPPTCNIRSNTDFNQKTYTEVVLVEKDKKNYNEILSYLYKNKQATYYLVTELDSNDRNQLLRFGMNVIKASDVVLPKKTRKPKQDTEFDYTAQKININGEYVSYKTDLKSVAGTATVYFIDQDYLVSEDQYRAVYKFTNKNNKNITINTSCYGGVEIFIDGEEKSIPAYTINTKVVAYSSIKNTSKKTKTIIEKLLNDGDFKYITELDFELSRVNLSTEESLVYYIDNHECFNDSRTKHLFKYIGTLIKDNEKYISIKQVVKDKNKGLMIVQPDTNIIKTCETIVSKINDEIVSEVLSAIETEGSYSKAYTCFRKHINKTIKHIVKSIDIPELSDMMNNIL